MSREQLEDVILAVSASRIRPLYEGLIIRARSEGLLIPSQVEGMIGNAMVSAYVLGGHAALFAAAGPSEPEVIDAWRNLDMKRFVLLQERHQ